jgi:RimJ/RimL family protein N-acetyltransferase
MTGRTAIAAYRVHTKRMVLRCREPADAPLVQAAVDASIEHLRPWMLWAANEPEDLAVKVQRLRQARTNFDLDKEYAYSLFDHHTGDLLGAAGLHHLPDEGVFEIGYWIHVDHINQGLATEAAGALTRVAFELLGTTRVEIHCDPLNVRSAAVAARLGFVHEATLRQRDVDSEGNPRDTMLWTLLAGEYDGSAARGIEIEAYDVMGERVL